MFNTQRIKAHERQFEHCLRKQTFYHAHGNLYAWQIFFKNLNCYLFFKKSNEDAYDGYDLAGPEDEHPFDEVCLDVGNIRL